MNVGIRRHSAGNYTVSALIPGRGVHRVTVTYFEHLRGWVAAAQWDRHLYTDPVRTKRVAVNEARTMIQQQEGK